MFDTTINMKPGGTSERAAQTSQAQDNQIWIND